MAGGTPGIGGCVKYASLERANKSGEPAGSKDPVLGVWDGRGGVPDEEPRFRPAVRIKDSGRSLRIVEDSSETELWLERSPGRKVSRFCWKVGGEPLREEGRGGLDGAGPRGRLPVECAGPAV